VYDVGDKVIYPAHGVALVVGREVRDIEGEPQTYLVLSVPERGWGAPGAMTVLVPEAKADELGVRTAITAEDADDVLEVLGASNVRVPSNWSRRFKNHQEKLKSGDVFQCAEVVRNLAVRDSAARLSTAERSMYARARTLLISELAVSWDVDDEAAEERVDKVLSVHS